MAAPKRKTQPKRSNVLALAKQETIENQKEVITSLVLNGDLSKMNQEQQVKYYYNLCSSAKLDPNTKPFDLIRLNGKLVMYANANCAQQLRKIHGISVIDQKTERIDDIIITTVKLQDKSGRIDTGTGAVNAKGAHGDMLANLIMKSETKAKRRGTLSLCGLGMLDETELETIPNAAAVNIDVKTGEIKSEPVMTTDDFDEEKEYTRLVNLLESRQSIQHLNACIPSLKEFKERLSKEHVHNLSEIYKRRLSELSGGKA